MIIFKNISITPMPVKTNEEFVITAEVVAGKYTWNDLLNIQCDELANFTWDEIMGSDLDIP